MASFVRREAGTCIQEICKFPLPSEAFHDLFKPTLPAASFPDSHLSFGLSRSSQLELTYGANPRLLDPLVTPNHL